MHWVVILAIALIVFGPKRLPELGRGLGQAIRGFKAGLHEAEAGTSSRPDDESKPRAGA